MAQELKVYETWDSDENEEIMEKGHYPSWLETINMVKEQDISNSHVLDFGCNRGGFLQLLYKLKPFKTGLGVDIAKKSIEIANSHKGSKPINYSLSSELENKRNFFDLAFSHEVIYLLSDLDEHAQTINRALKVGGVYYCVIGEYAENPLWERWKSIIESFSEAKPYTYSLNAIHDAFTHNGFKVGFQKLVCKEFFEFEDDSREYIRNPEEYIDFMTNRMIIFRCVKI